MKHFILATIIILFVGCGSSHTPPENQNVDTPSEPTKQETPSSAKNIFTIGDDQNVLEGNSVKINASLLDKSKEFTKYTWKEDGEILSTSEEFTSENLSAGEHHISLEVTDGDGNVYADSILVVIKKEVETNSPPIAKSLNFELNEDEQYLGSLAGNDEDGDELSYLFVSFPKHGKLTGSSANLRYTPDANYNGNDSFVYKTNDGTIDSAYATVNIEIATVNDVPVATTQNISLVEDSFKDIILAGTDIESDDLTFAIVTAPLHGVFDGTRYTPNPNYHGSDSFTFQASDATDDSVPALVTIEVSSLNDLPIGVADTANTPEDTPIIINVLANDSDTENALLTISTITQPDNGIVQIIDNNISYTPNLNFYGVDTFTYQPRDDSENGLAVTVTVTITSINDVPIATSQTFTLNEDTNKSITLIATDVENDTLTYILDTNTTNGTLSLTAGGRITYTPNANIYGSDSFTYHVQDQLNSSNVETVNIAIAPVNDIPIASPDDNQTDEDNNITFNILSNDSDVDDNHVLSLVDVNSTEGNFTFTADGNLTFSPIGYFDTLSAGTEHNVILFYTMKDEHNATSDSNITIRILGVDDIPTVETIQTQESNLSITNGIITGSIVANDPDSIVTFIDANTSNGFDINSSGHYTFTPSTDNYKYLSEGESTTLTIPIMIGGIEQTISIDIIGKNDAPTVQNISATIDNTMTATLALSAQDIDGSDFIYEILSDDSNGTHTLSDNTFTYVPEAHSSGTVTYIYKAIDAYNASSNEATITIEVNTTNIAPLANNVIITTTEDNAKTFDLNASDTNNDTLTYHIDTNTTNGTLTLVDGQVTYTPNENSYGVDSFTYHANDQQFSSNIATVNITIDPINDTPIANNDYNQTDEDTSITFNILTNDSDVDSNAELTLIGINITEGIFAFSTDGNLTFSPIGYFDSLSAGIEHNVTLSYTMKDEHNAIAEGNVTITVLGVDDAVIIDTIVPQESNLSITNGTITGSISATDIDNAVTFFDANSSNGFDINASSGSYTYTPVADTYTYLTEGESTTLTIPIMIGSVEQNVSITIIGKNDAPSINSITNRTLSEDDSPISGTVTATDPDDNNLSFSAPFMSDFTFTSDGNYTFNPTSYQSLAQGVEVNIMIPISVTDGLLTDEQNLTITITGSNDAPIANAGADIFVNEGSLVTFNASGSFDIDDNDILTYEWKEGATVLTADNISFTKSDFSVGVHNITLTVTDNNEVSSTNSITVTVYAIGPITFSAHTVTTNVDNSEWLEMADLDSDGDLDILSAATGNNQRVAWYENRGDNTFTEHSISTTANSPESVRAADMNNDDKLDIIYSTYNNTNPIIVCMNNGDKTFTCAPPTGTTSVTQDLSSITIVDIDNDNKNDIVSASWGNHRIDWYKNNGDADLSAPDLIDGTDMAQATSLASADFNKDGNIDIVVTSKGDNRVEWYENDGSGNFTSHFVSNIIKEAYAVDIADINNDGYDDIISTSHKDDTIYWHKSTQSSSPAFQTPIAIGTNLKDVWYASGVDIDNDGDIDILSASSEGSGRIVWYENIGVDDDFNEHIIADSQDNVIRVFAADIDNDGNMDVVAGQKDGTVTFYKNDTLTIVQKIPKIGSLNTGTGANRSYTSGTDIVNEVHTGLMWQDDNDAGTITTTWTEAISYCEGLTLNSFEDWRLPNGHELYYLTDKEEVNAASYALNFANIVHAQYWSYTQEVANYSGPYASYISFVGGNEHYAEQSESYHVRCVRGTPTIFNMIRNDTKEIVVDHKSALMWQDESAVLNNTANFSDATIYCADLNFASYTDWRLPNANELYSTIDHDRNDPAAGVDGSANNLAFQYVKIDDFTGWENQYWSSTERLDNNEMTTLEYNHGHDYTDATSATNYVRCVRDMP